METKEQIIKEFDKYLEKYIPREQWGIFRYGIVKTFWLNKIDLFLKEIVPEQKPKHYHDFDDALEASGFNQCRSELLSRINKFYKSI